MEKTKAAGNILPLSLIMMLIILMAGIGIGIVVLEGSRQSQSTDQSVTAYYMADSGVERQLYEVRKDNQSSDYVNGLSAPYFNGGRWVSTGALELPTSKTFDTIATSSFAVLDLFNPDDMTRTFNINTMNLIWTNDPSCGATPARGPADCAGRPDRRGFPRRRRHPPLLRSCICHRRLHHYGHHH